MTVRFASSLCLLLLCSTATGEDRAYELEHNPFTRPQLGAVAATRGEPVRVEVVKPELRATLVGGHEPLANVGGRLLAIGEEVDGYTLTGIGEGFAKFRRGADETTIFIQAPAPERTKGRR